MKLRYLNLGTRKYIDKIKTNKIEIEKYKITKNDKSEARKYYGN